MWFIVVARAVTPIEARALIAPLGFDQLDTLEQILFTFNVERHGVVTTQREWTWNLSTRQVTRRVDGVALTFVTGAPTNDEERKADAQFVNDSFWLAPQLHARWAGADLTVTAHDVVPVPVGTGSARKVVMQYASDGGGYTPGDAYDLYLDGDGRIVAWSYRKGNGNGSAPDLTTTFESYVQVGPLSIATEHHDADGSFRLYFTGLAVVPKGE